MDLTEREADAWKALMTSKTQKAERVLSAVRSEMKRIKPACVEFMPTSIDNLWQFQVFLGREEKLRCDVTLAVIVSDDCVSNHGLVQRLITNYDLPKISWSPNGEKLETIEKSTSANVFVQTDWRFHQKSWSAATIANYLCTELSKRST